MDSFLPLLVHMRLAGWIGFASEEKTGQKHCKPTYQIPHTINWHVKIFYRASNWEIAMTNVSFEIKKAKIPVVVRAMVRGADKC